MLKLGDKAENWSERLKIVKKNRSVDLQKIIRMGARDRTRHDQMIWIEEMIMVMRPRYLCNMFGPMVDLATAIGQFQQFVVFPGLVFAISNLSGRWEFFKTQKP